MRIGWGAAAGAAVWAAVWLGGWSGPAAGQVTCRSNALGSEVCTGLPAPTLRSRDPYAPPRNRGLGAVQDPPRSQQAGPKLTPPRAVDILGTKFLNPQDLPPRRPPLAGVAPVRQCERDALGNLICR